MPDLDRGDEHLDSSDTRRSRRELVEVELELLALAVGPAIIPLSWDFSVYWFASFGGADRRLPEQGRNRR